jgi:Peptidase family M23
MCRLITNVLILIGFLFGIHAKALAIDCKIDKGASTAKTQNYSIEQSCFTANGWTFPLKTTKALRTNYAWDYKSKQYVVNRKLTHGGVDIAAALGEIEFTATTEVVAIADGKVIGIRRDNSAENNISRVVVEHTTADGKNFVVLYGHSYSSDGVVAGSQVTAGQTIGTLRSYGSPYHLHLELYYPYDIQVDEYGLRQSNNSFGPIRTNSQTDSFEFLNLNKPQLVPVSFFDGAGSLISPAGTCSGCKSDVARLHSHDISSSAIFQVVRTAEGACSRISLNGLQAAYIVWRRWNDPYPGADPTNKTGVFKLNSLPAVIEVPSDGYNLLQVITTSPIPTGEIRTIAAACTTAPLTVAPVSLVRTGSTPSNTLIKDGNSNVSAMAGMGSLISIAPPLGNNGYGVTIDYAQIVSGSKSTAVFQVYPSSQCTRVRLSTTNGVDIERIFTKVWDQSTFTLSTQADNNNATITLTPNTWTIIQARTRSIASGRVIAKCAT